MTSQTQLLIIALTWAPLFVLYSINRFFLRGKFLKPSLTLVLPTPPDHLKPPGSFLSKAGVLLVFVVNILTIFLVILIALSAPLHRSLSILQVELPLWANIVGSVLFIINNSLGLLALVYNPNYTPLYSQPPQGSILATQGPYALIRHPRYAVEALQNIAFFLFTGIWFPLLGLLGWVCMYRQARAEEDYLMTLVPQAYGDYRKRTGMFLPKLKRE